MTHQHEQLENLTYVDEYGNHFEIAVVKHFSFGEKQYVLAKDREEHHHHHGETCNCHHDDNERKSSEEESYYVFEWINDNHTLISVSDETLQALESVLNAM
ncbi:DUF1292 domain-containing protein [Acetobacterium woodii]|uniref:DUF1292 domain-containing protein n=1 Tax=Acetobacterium woodii TaxID=33952 RepID=UPI0002E8521B|nr:DUF1292 domain-containing protein [Acetobacterium woodii]